MKKNGIFTFEEVVKYVRLDSDAWDRVNAAPKEEYAEAIRRELKWPEGFLEKLKGKSLEEQMKYYRVVDEIHYSRTAYGEVTKENCTEFGYALEEHPDVTAIIVDDGVLIGVRIKYYGDREGWGAPLFPYQDICTYYASDNNGSGSKDREDYAHLCCVMPDENE